MPVSNNLQHFTSGDTITASSVNESHRHVEEYLNGGIESSDLAVSDWVSYHHVVRPEFYGSPAPRVTMTSSDVHHRSGRGREDVMVFHSELGPRKWHPIPGLMSTFHVDRKGTADNTTVLIRSNWRSWESHDGVLGDTATADGNNTYIENRDYRCALFAMFVDGVKLTGTERFLMLSTNWETRFSMKNHSIVCQRNLSPGMHSVGVRIFLLDPTEIGTAAKYNNTWWQRIFVYQRFLNIEVNYI